MNNVFHTNVFNIDKNKILPFLNFDIAANEFMP